MNASPQTLNQKIHVLLIDDERADYVITRDILEGIPNDPYDLTWVTGLREAEAAIQEFTFDVILVDYKLGRHTGVDVIHRLKSDAVYAPIVMLTAWDNRDIDEAALVAGAEEFLTKGSLTVSLLDRTIRYALEKHRLREQIVRSRDDIRTILDELRTGTAITHHDGTRISFASGAFQRLVGATNERIVDVPWTDVLPITEAERLDVKSLIDAPPEKRSKLPLQWVSPESRRYWTELEVIDDPHDDRRKILVLYDVSEIQGLRRILDGKAEFHDIVGQSDPMQAMFALVRELARYDTTVLVEGETGTGKELVARALHFSGGRAEMPFIAVNCAGLTESLLASQLFGHKKGAFTGAASDHVGFFEAADGGTIFLDEVSDIPHPVQTMLLRVLQEREIVRVGESVARHIDVRLISASNRDLTQSIEDGKLRSDLLYRLRVARINLPALRDRREDIALLAARFLDQFVAKTGKRIEGVSHDAMTQMFAYRWPGNVRELQNAIEAAAVCCHGRKIDARDLPPELQNTYSDPTPTSPTAPSVSEGPEEQRVLQALREAGGNRAKAARLLGISRTTLYRRLSTMDQ